MASENGGRVFWEASEKENALKESIVLKKVPLLHSTLVKGTVGFCRASTLKLDLKI